ncbi:hypothetical protein [Paenibacillus lactis]|nr:hypothetical protein [Paenibacillus lactis]
MHDCIIASTSTEGQNLSVTFEHIDVLSDHPLNYTGMAMYSGEATLTFVDFEIVESILFDTSEVKNKRRIVVEINAQKRELHYSDLLVDFEVLKDEVLNKEGNYLFHRFDGTTSKKYNSDFGYWVIKYKKLIMEWDELIDKAWFEER